MYNTQISNHKSRNHLKVSSTIRTIYYTVSFIFFIGCSSNEIEEGSTPIATTPSSVVQVPQGCPSGRVANANPTGDFTTLVWADEFNEDGAPCENNWFHEIIPPDNGGWYNNEQQFYTDSRSNSIVEDGVLKITAIKEQFEGKEYTSARMTTQRLFEFLYGKVEIRAKLPQGQGTWPALWFLGANIDSVGWPSCGEMDLMEHGNDDPGLVSSAVHQANENGDAYYTSGGQLIANEATEFHLYTMEWTATEVKFFVDGTQHHEMIISGDSPFNRFFFIILNVAMGGDFTGNTIDPNFVSSSMDIDYIRVYQ